MNHRRYEELLLADLPLTSLEQEDLRLHLENCADCAALRAGWSQVTSAFAARQMVAPSPDFVSRWSARLAAEAEERVRRQAWRLFAFTSVATTGLAVVLAVYLWLAGGSIPNLFADLLQQALRLWIWARMAGELTRAIATSLPTPVAAGVVVGSGVLVAAAGVMAALGSATVIRFSFQGGRK
jgi:hypothetical protein